MNSNINNIFSFYEDSRKLHSSYGCNRSPFIASQEVTTRANVFSNSFIGSSIQRCGLFSSSPSKTDENESVQSVNEFCNTGETNNAPQTEMPGTKVDSGPTDAPQSVKRRRRVTKRTKFSDSDSDSDSVADLSRDSLRDLWMKKEELPRKKHTELEALKSKVLITEEKYHTAIQRIEQETETLKKFTIQSFAKSLLDVADILGEASSVVKDRITQIDTAEDPAGAVPLLKKMLEGVEMTEKQLVEVFKKFGVERYDPMNEQFDPNRHNAVVQVSDQSKPPNTVAVVMKPGYMLNDQIIRPAEVGVVPNVAADIAGPREESESQDFPGVGHKLFD